MNVPRWLLAQARADRWPVALFTLAVAVVVALAALVPPAVGGLSSAAMSGAFGTLTAQQGDLVGRWRGAPQEDPAAPDPAAGYLAAAEALRTAQPLPLRDVLRPPQLVAELGFPLVVTPPESSGYHRLTFAVLVDATLAEHAELVSGTWPAAPDPAEPVSDIVVLHDAAERLGWALGSQPLPGLRLSGTFRPTDPTDRRWEQVPRGIRYAELVDPNLGTELVSAVFLHRGALSAGASGRRPQINHLLWFGINAPAPSQGEVDAELLAGQLTAMLSRTLPLDDGRATVRFFSELGEMLDAVAVEQRTLTSLALVLAVGPLILAGLLVALAGAAVREGRSVGTSLLRARGLAPGQLLGWTAAEGAVLGLLGGVAALGVLGVALPDGGWRRWPAGLTLAILLGGVMPAMHAWGARPGTRSGPGPRRVRLAAELTLLGLAAVSVALLVERPSAGGLEALAAAAPALVTLAAGALLWRMHPILLRLLAGRLREGRGLAGPLGVSRALRGAGGGAVPLAAVLLGVSMAVVGGVLTTSLEATSRDAAWAVNGAQIRAAGPRMTDDVVAGMRAVDGVAAVGRLTRLADSVPLTSRGGEVTHVAVWSVDEGAPDAYRGTPLEPRLPGALADAGGPLPVVLGGSTTGESGPATLGGMGEVTIVGRLDLLPGAGTPEAWALVDSGRWLAAGGAPESSTLALVSIDDGAAADQVAADLRDQLGTAVVTTVDEQLRSRLGPASQAFSRIVAMAGAVGLILMTMAVVGAESLAGGARRGSTRLLRALGAAPGEIRRSVAWEVAPGLVLALGAGIVLGIAVAGILLAGLDYSFITGAGSASLVVDPASLGIVMVLVLAAFAVVVWSAARRTTVQQEVP